MDETLEMFVQFSAENATFTYSLNRVVAETGPLVFEAREAAKSHPLAGRLMIIEGVLRVGLARDSVTVECDPAQDLEEVAARVELVLRHCFSAAHRGLRPR